MSSFPVLELLHLLYCFGGSVILYIPTQSKNKLKFESRMIIFTRPKIVFLMLKNRQSINNEDLDG
jgi:hypothetical protein